MDELYVKRINQHGVPGDDAKQIQRSLKTVSSLGVEYPPPHEGPSNSAIIYCEYQFIAYNRSLSVTHVMAWFKNKHRELIQKKICNDLIKQCFIV